MGEWDIQRVCNDLSSLLDKAVMRCTERMVALFFVHGNDMWRAEPGGGVTGSCPVELGRYS